MRSTPAARYRCRPRAASSAIAMSRSGGSSKGTRGLGDEGVRSVFCLVACMASAMLVSAQARPTLTIYAIDVEGGNATLLVSPTGESLLDDAGNGGMGAVRDATRIV